MSKLKRDFWSFILAISTIVSGLLLWLIIVEINYIIGWNIGFEYLGRLILILTALVIVNILSIRIVTNDITEENIPQTKILKSNFNRIISASIFLLLLILSISKTYFDSMETILIIFLIAVITGRILLLIKSRIETLKTNNLSTRERTLQAIIVPLIIVYLCIGVSISLGTPRGADLSPGFRPQMSFTSQGFETACKPFITNNSASACITNNLGNTITLLSEDVQFLLPTDRRTILLYQPHPKTSTCKEIRFCPIMNITCTDTRYILENGSEVKIMAYGCNFKYKKYAITTGTIVIPYVNSATNITEHLNVTTVGRPK